MLFLVIAVYSILFIEDPTLKALGLGIAALGFILPKIMTYQEKKSEAVEVVQFCPPHKWVYNEATMIYCNVCNKRPGQVE